MISRKLLQHLTGVMVAIVLIGCTAPTETPVAIATYTLIPTPVPTITPSPTPTSVKISSFEECYVGGWIQGTYPRQCITNNGEIFIEALEEGVIYTRTYGEAKSHETGYFITLTKDGGHLITGAANYGCWVLKLDSSGEKEWESIFEQELRQRLQLSTSAFRCLQARQTPDDGYVIMGIGSDVDVGRAFRKLFFITLDQEGNWESGQVIAEKAGKIPYLDQDGNLIRLTSIGIEGKVTETIDGGYIVVSKYPYSYPYSSTHVTKTDENGNYLWDRNLCLDKNIQQSWEEETVCSYNYIWDVIQLQDGSFVVTGVHRTVGTWLLKIDANGNVEWIRESGGYALIQLSDGGYLIAGEQADDGMLIKTDGEGNMQWSKTFGGIDSDDRFMAIEPGLNSEIIVMGWTHPSVGLSSDDLWLVGLDSTILK